MTQLPAAWPAGRTLAVSVSVMLEGWSEGAAPGIGPMGNVLKAGPLTAVPFTMEVNDMPLSVRYGNEPEAFSRTVARILEGWPSLPPRPACLDLTAHAHVYGRPMGAIEFARSIALVKEAPFAFLTHHDALGGMFAA